MCVWLKNTTHCIRSTTGRLCQCLWQGSVHFHWLRLCLCVFVHVCILHIYVCVCQCARVCICVCANPGEWDGHFRSLSINTASISHHFLFHTQRLTHTHTHTHLRIGACNLTTLNNFLICHCVVTRLCVRLMVRLPVCVSGKWFGVMAQRVGWEAAGDSSQHAWMHKGLCNRGLLYLW